MFPTGESQLPAAGKTAMDPVIKRLQADENLRLQLKAYASGGQDSTNTARRLSLSRALAVRAFLIDNNIQSTRMDVRALGDRNEGGPADRVDLVVVAP
jgi:outer membrane protein OmpA-like peptidoglycan-associated protein